MQEAIQIKFSKEGMLVLNAVLAFILYGIALSIKKEDILALRTQWKSAITGVFSQFILLPLVTWLVILVLKPNAGIAMGMILVAACPGGNVSNLITYLAKGNVTLSISLTGLSTLLAVFFTPFNIAFYAKMYEPSSLLLREVSLSFPEMLQTILLLMFIPLSLGGITSYFFNSFAAKAANVLQKISVVFLWLFIAFAFVGNAKAFTSNLHLVFGVVVVHNAVAFLSGYFAAKVTRLSLADTKTVIIETGIQNAGLGLILVFNFFEGNGMMALVAATWGVWHLLSGWVLAMAMRRKVE
jgi:BASS family bile acid:Na+ symporter